MLAKLVICLFFAAHIHAGRIPLPTFTSTSTAQVDSQHSCSSLDIDSELKKIATTRLTNRENELLSGNILRYYLAGYVNTELIGIAQETIGLMELRSVLGFTSAVPWTHYSRPSEDEIAAAPTIEAYYELKEPRDQKRSLDSMYYFEENLIHAISFLDKRFPAIRKIYRCYLMEARQRPGAEIKIDRKEVDHMIDEYKSIATRINKARSGIENNNIQSIANAIIAEYMMEVRTSVPERKREN